MKTHPKRTKEYSHIKDCKEQPRKISDQGEIQLLCDTHERMVRIHEPKGNGSWNQCWTVRPKVCKTDAYRKWEEFSKSFTFPAKEQIYRFEPKKIDELEMKNHPKRIKKDNYITDCKEQPKEICDQWDIRPHTEDGTYSRDQQLYHPS